jgi:hypothetical protein
VSDRLRPEEVDRLLREALRDTPSPGDEERLRAVVRKAWVDARATRAWAAPPPNFAGRKLHVALGVAAGLVLALGLGLHLAFPPRLVAASLAAQAPTLRAVAALRRVAAMDCVVDTAAAADRTGRYHVSWRAPEEVHVRLEGPDGASWDGSVPPNEVGRLAAAPSGLREDDPRLAPVREILGPDRIADLLGGRPGVRVVLDGTSGLPVRLEAGWTATCAYRRAERSHPPLAGATGRDAER